MGETLGREFSLEPVDTGRTRMTGGIVPDPNAQVPDISIGPGLSVPGLPAVKPQTAPVTRPSFLQAFLANLGPALAGGLAYTGDPQHPYAGIGGAFAGIQKQQQVKFQQGIEQQQLDLQNQAAARAASAQASTQALQTEEINKLRQTTPLDVQQKQLEISLMQGQIGFYANPGNLDKAVADAVAPLGKLAPEEQSQINAAKKDAQITRKFDPINAAVKTISQDRASVSKADETSGYKDYLADKTLDPGKTKNRATFLAWKAKQNPMAVISGNMLPAGNALDQQAELYSQTHEIPSGLARSPGTIVAILNRAAQLHPEQSLAGNQATFKADQASLANLQKNFDVVTAFENTAIKNIDQVMKVAKTIPDLGTRFANVPIRDIDAKLIGTKEMSRLRTALATAQAESAKVLTSANASGVLSDSARDDAKDFLDGKLPFSSMAAQADQLKIDFGNRHSSYQDAINAIKGRMGGKSGGSEPMTITLPSGKKVTIQ